MTLEHVKKTYEKFGHDDPLYAVLSEKGTRHGKWDPAEFFEHGRREIREVLKYAQRFGLTLHRGRALDFGCGVGRLTQALADEFELAVGVDIAESMVQRAREYNQHGDRVRYVVNTTDDLRMFESESFDFVYSSITLQHIPPAPAANYILEFFRLLRPEGLVIFHVPDGKPFEPGSWRAGLYTLRREHLRRLWKRVRGKPPVEMHYIAREQVESIIEESGGRLLDVVDLLEGRRRWGSLRYCAVKAGE